jgi:hypothetical protein
VKTRIPPTAAAVATPTESVATTLSTLSAELIALASRWAIRVAWLMKNVETARTNTSIAVPVRLIYPSRLSTALRSRRLTVATETPNMAAIWRLVRPSR